MHFKGFPIAASLALATLILSACGETPNRLTDSTQPATPSPTATLHSAQAEFGAKQLPAELAGPSVIGSYARGCLARAQALPLDGTHWQVMRPSRNRYWGHPTLIAYITQLADTANATGWSGLLVGDLGQPRGGPAATGHASHQIGLDVDIWLTPMPSSRVSDAERETMTAPSMLTVGQRHRLMVNRSLFTAAQARLIKAAAQSDEVVRIFVNPVIKQALCRSAGRDRSWLGKVRPWRGHDEHFHVRLACPADETMCQAQDAPPEGDGCGAELTAWLKSKDWLPGNAPETPPAPIPLSALPNACLEVLHAPDLQRTAVSR